MFVRCKTWRYVFWFLILGLVAWLSEVQGWLVEAGTLGAGTGVTLGGLDNLAETVDTYARGPLGKVIGMCMAMGGIAAGALGRYGMAAGGLGTGVAIAFVPNIVGTAFDTGATAPLSRVVSVTPLALSEGLIGLTKQAGLVICWPLFLILRAVRDPVVWIGLTLAWAIRPGGMIAAWGALKYVDGLSKRA